MATTPVYGWPYQALSDPPNGASLGEGLALGAEATVAALSALTTPLVAQVAALVAAAPYRDEIVTVGAVASVEFAGIPSTLKSVRISYTARGDLAANFTDITFRINGDATAVYSRSIMYATNPPSAVPTSTGTLGLTAAPIGAIMAASVAAGIFSPGVIEFPGWNSPHAGQLAAIGHAGLLSPTAVGVIVEEGLYATAGPYTSITLLPGAGNFIAGCGFYLEGLR